jgi:hypothetical protein
MNAIGNYFSVQHLCQEDLSKSTDGLPLSLNRLGNSDIEKLSLLPQELLEAIITKLDFESAQKMYYSGRY